MTKYTTVTHED